ncbi:hypothetical protein ACXWTF_05940 [Thiomicrolovo sp. ZZH C-3]
MKTLCKIRLAPNETPDKALKKLLGSSKYYCRKCLRTAAEKGALCKPEKL